MIINFFDNYDEPTNENTVTYLYIPEYGKSYKAFMVLPRIYIIPELTIPKILGSCDTPFAKKYLATSEDRSKYLKQMSTLFRRLNTKPLGKQLLTTLVKSVPLNKDVNFDNNNSLFSDKNPIDKKPTNTNNYKTVEVNAIVSVTLCGIRTVLSHSFNNKQPIYTSRTSVSMPSDIVIKTISENNDPICMDPIVVLAHELLHAIRISYAFWNKKDLVEEDIITGFSEITDKSVLAKIQNSFDLAENEYKDCIKKELNIICQLLNDKFHGKKLDTSLHNLKVIYAKKYLFERKKGEKFKVTKEQIDSLQYLLNFKFTERNICKEFNITPRKSYREPLGVSLQIDVTNHNLYSINDGILVPFQQLEEHPAEYSYIMEEKIIKALTEHKRKISKDPNATLTWVEEKSFFKKQQDKYEQLLNKNKTLEEFLSETIPN